MAPLLGRILWSFASTREREVVRAREGTVFAYEDRPLTVVALSRWGGDPSRNTAAFRGKSPKE